MSDVVLRADNLHKQLTAGEMTVNALNGVSLEIKRGDFVAIVGPSGSGKSTLLGIIGGLDTPTSGNVYIDDVDITNMNERELTRIRNEKIGFIFQSFNLIPTLSALENVALPIQFSANKQFNPKQRATEILEQFGLGERLGNRPTQLSGGQQQRVAIARSLANNPPLLLADEPTGNLDTKSTEVVMNAFRTIQKNYGTTIIVVTHDMDIASQVDHLITLVDGEIASDTDPRSTSTLAAVRHYQEKRQTGELPQLVES